MTGSGREEEEGHGRARQRGLGLRGASALEGLRAPEPGSRGSGAGEPGGGTLKSTHNPIAEKSGEGQAQLWTWAVTLRAVSHLLFIQPEPWLELGGIGQARPGGRQLNWARGAME